MSPDAIAEAVRRYVARERDLTQTARDLGVHILRARRILVEAGVPIRSGGRPRDRLGSSNGRGRRSLAEPMRTIGKRRLAEAAQEYPLDEHPAAGAGRPTTWGECRAKGLGVERPCPWVSCAQHLYLEVSDAGSIVYRHPDREVDELTETCSLAVAERGGATLEEVGVLINVTRERVRQVEVMGLVKIESLLRRAGVKRCVDLLPEDRREAL